MTTFSLPLVQTVLECAPGASLRRATEEDEEVLFVLSGTGMLELDGTDHELAPETGAYLAPGDEYEIGCRGPAAMHLVSVRIPDPVIAPADPDRVVVQRLEEQPAQEATTDREFRIVADPATGLQSATHFVGYIPTARAPEHFHTYDEVLYVLEGDGALHVGDDHHPVCAGSRIELPARTVHCLENTGEDVMRVVAVFRPAGSPAAAYYPDGTPAHPSAPPIPSQQRS